MSKLGKRAKCVINGFRYPSADSIGGRTSTICRSMACTLSMRVACSPYDEQLWMRFFPEKKCAYCGDAATHLDHLYPLVENSRPTGYGTEPANLVPCCGKCNQSKRNLGWKEFMDGDNCRHIDEGKCARIERIEKFQREMPATKKEINDEMIKRFDEILAKFDRALGEADEELRKLKDSLESH